MCDACAPRIDPSRRAFLRRAAHGAALLAVGGTTWTSLAERAAAGSGAWPTRPRGLMGGLVDGFAGGLVGGIDDGGSDGSEGAGAFDTGRSPSVGRIETAPTGITATRRIPAVNTASVAAPPVIRRADWGADESIRVPVRVFAPIRKLVVHHTATDNRPADPASVVRYVHRYHVETKGYADLGYNFLIDHRGNIYEGRYSRRYGDEAVNGEDHNGWGVVGAHAKAMNAGTCGICLIGNFDVAAPTDAALASLQWLLAYKASRHRIDVTVDDPFENLYGDWFQFGNLAGHRNVGSTACPGKYLYQALASLRSNVGGQAGHWDTLVAEIPRLQRYEWTKDGQGPLADGSGMGGGASTGSGTSAEGGAGTDAAGDGTTTGTGGTGGGTGTGSGPGTGATATKLSAYRAATTDGHVFTAGTATKLGQPGATDGTVVAIANPGWGDGFVTLTRSGIVRAFGTVANLGDVSTKHAGDAVDVALTPSGAGYWILMANGGIYPFGDARYHSSPKRAGLTAASVRLAARPQGDGYWVLLADGTVRGFGAAASLGGPGTAAGAPVGIAATSTGAGYRVLLDTGEVAAYGDAVDAGGMKSKNVRWSKPAAAIMSVRGSDGYVISSRDGGLYPFHGAPFLGSFAGSGTTVVGLVPAAR